MNFRFIFLLFPLLLISCVSEEENENCVLRMVVFDWQNPPAQWYYKCYEGIYTHSECVDKVVEGYNDEDNYTYDDYTDKSCEKVCNQAVGDCQVID